MPDSYLKDNPEVMQAKTRFGIIGNSPALLEAIARAVKVAPIDLSVLVYGESGSGKEFFPKIIHQFSARKHKKFIAVNCGAIPEGTIDSELFGHEKGSFTGAIASRKGYFEEADGGTIFLDEVAELPLTTQARLLRVLESGEFIKVGSSIVQKTNIRIVAATNVNLPDAVRKGKFREDLYYRLSTVTIEVPNLHDRGSDIGLLARKFASDFSEKYLTAPITFSREAISAMSLYRWPGNVRQLKNIIDQLSLFHAGTEVSRRTMIETLPIDHTGLSTPVAGAHNPDSETERKMLWQLVISLKAEISRLRDIVEGSGQRNADTEENFTPLSKITTLAKYPEADLLGISNGAKTLESAEKAAITEALARNAGNKRKTAEELNISLRTLYRKLQDYETES
ncbi:MAG: sigma-54 dependent transcriptional regulator [Candidatus Amulumruptor caecigallinarius]|nr:sigma-54 dependent transcriptional regulator [Candidatus Amulumruptor caecigallinarius]